MHITHAYNQAEDDRWRSDEETSEGVCFGLSVWWIIKNAQSANYWEWMQGEEGQEMIKGAFVQQKTGSKYLYLNRFQSAQKIINGYFPGLQVPRGEDLVKEGPEFTEATKIKSGYYYTSIEGLYPNKDGQYPDQSKRSAHGIAAYISADGPCKYFDPNQGEGQVDTADKMTQELTEIVEFYRVKEAKISKSRFVLRS